MKLSDKVKIELTISDLIELVNHIADGTELGDDVSQIIVDATPQKIKDFICDELQGCKI